MAVIVTDNRTIKDEADATTNWTAAGTSTGTATGTASPTPREATAHIVTTATSTSPANQWLWHTGDSLGTGPHLIYIWMLTTATIGTRANGGLMILIGDGANRVGYHVGGDDFAPFRVDSNGLVGYMCFCIDTAQLSTWPNGHTVQLGTRAGLEANLNAITQVGTGCQVLAKAVGGAVNYWNDIIRHGVATTISTSGLTISGGTSGTPGKFTEIEAEDRAIANQKAHGIIRQLGTGAFGVQGTLRFGDQGTGSSWFEETNVTIIFEDRGFATTRYKIFISDNGTGTTTFRLGTKVGTGVTATGTNGVSLIAPPGVGAQFDALTDTNVTDVFIYGSTFAGFSSGIQLNAGHELIGCNILNSGIVNVGSGSTMVNTVFSNTTASSSMYWNASADFSGRLDGCSFNMGTDSHAIEIGPNAAATYNLVDVNFSGYGGTPGSNLTESTGPTNATIYNNSGTEVTINVIDSTEPSVRNGVGSSTIIIVPDITITIVANVSLIGAEIRIYDLDAVLPFKGTEIAGVESHVASTYVFSSTAANVVWVQIMKPDYEEFGLTYTLPGVNSTLNVILNLDVNA